MALLWVLRNPTQRPCLPIPASARWVSWQRCLAWDFPLATAKLALIAALLCCSPCFGQRRAVPRGRSRCRDRRARSIGLVLVPGAAIALGLAGLPLTGGALAKLAAKVPFGYGFAGLLATCSAAGTALLMLHFLHRVASMPSQKAAKETRTPLVIAMVGDGSSVLSDFLGRRIRWQGWNPSLMRSPRS